MKKETAVEYMFRLLDVLTFGKDNETQNIFNDILERAKEMEKKQLFVASNTSAKESYEAGQVTMSCGCYEIADATTYEEWLYEQFKSKEQ